MIRQDKFGEVKNLEKYKNDLDVILPLRQELKEVKE